MLREKARFSTEAEAPGAFPMKIALVCDWFSPRIGGMERHLAELAKHLAAARHDVTVITPTPGPAAATSGYRIHRLKVTLLPIVHLMWTPAGFRRLGQAIRGGNFDVVHVHASIISPAAFAALYVAQQAGLPTVTTGHSISGGFTRLFQWIDRQVRWTQWNVAFSTVSERVAREVRPLVAPHQVDVLPNAIDPAEWHLAPQLPRDGIVIACVMRLARRKRGVALLRAFHHVRTQLPGGFRVQLHIAGEGPERARWERLSRRLGLTDSVRFLGACTVEDVKALLASSDFFVLASKLEAFGIAALEARAAGLPVVAMREGGVGEFIADGKEGLLAADDHQLAQQMLRLCIDASLRNRIATHNRRTPVVFTWPHTLAAHLATYARARALCPDHRPFPMRKHAPAATPVTGPLHSIEAAVSIRNTDSVH